VKLGPNCSKIITQTRFLINLLESNESKVVNETIRDDLEIIGWIESTETCLDESWVVIKLIIDDEKLN